MTEDPELDGGARPGADVPLPPPAPPSSPRWPAPASSPSSPRRGTSGRTAVAVVLIIVGVVLGSNLVNAAVPLPEETGQVDPGPVLPGDPGRPGETMTPLLGESAPPVAPGPVAPGIELTVGAGYTLTPPDGWTVVGSEEGWTVLQKSGVLLIAGGVPWTGTASDLALAYRDAWFENGQLTGDDPQPGTVGDGIPAAAVTYTGVANGTQVDGVIVAASAYETGLLLNAYGASGSLDGVSDDIDAILASVRHWAE